MENVLQADIFFFITTIAVVLITVVFLVVLTYLILILRSVKRLMGKVESKVEEISDDIDELRENVRAGAERLSQIISVFSVSRIAERLFGFFTGRGRKKRRDVEYEVDEEDEY